MTILTLIDNLNRKNCIKWAMKKFCCCVGGCQPRWRHNYINAWCLRTSGWQLWRRWHLAEQSLPENWGSHRHSPPGRHRPCPLQLCSQPKFSSYHIVQILRCHHVIRNFGSRTIFLTSAARALICNETKLKSGWTVVEEAQIPNSIAGEKKLCLKLLFGFAFWKKNLDGNHLRLLWTVKIPGLLEETARRSLSPSKSAAAGLFSETARRSRLLPLRRYSTQSWRVTVGTAWIIDNWGSRGEESLRRVIGATGRKNCVKWSVSSHCLSLCSGN